MKILLNYSKMLLLPVLMCMTTLAIAGEDFLPDVVIKKLDGEQKVLVQINNLKDEATIRMVDARENLLTEETLVAQELRTSKIFNLEKLPDGNYAFVVSMNSKEIYQPVILSAKDIVVVDDQRQVYFVPTIKVGDEYVDVSWINDKISEMKVKITSPSGEEVFEDEISNVLKVERRYNLEKLGRGNYTMIISTPYRTHYKLLEVE